MAIWEIAFDPDHFQYLDTTDSLEWRRMFVGQPIAEAWQPMTVSVSQDLDKLMGEFPSLGGVPPIFTQRAVDLLAPLIQQHVEFLPLQCATASLYAVNILTVMNCLDHARSRLKLFSSGRVMRIEEYAFIEGCLGDVPIFKLPEQLINRQYVSDTFKQAVAAHGLHGMTFTQIAP